ncbi:MAG: energy transducer TonB [Alphaproteobacteria bacterium]|nr:energy transducer TonB [Alphaproteobacteria bacterium]
MWNNSHQPRLPYMLSEKHFAMTLCVVLLLHASSFIAWSMSPSKPVQNIPIRTMNIRLGEADDTLDAAENKAFSSNAPQVEAVIDKLADEVFIPKPKPAPEKDEMKQYVRETNAPLKKTTKGSKTGARDAEIMSRYTQLISLWIQKFKVYPEEARQKGLKGSTVVRIRIDRRGTIHYYSLERSTGIPLLDNAAIDMIRRANPVPAVPDDYPAGDVFEFLVPVNFSLL